MKRLFAILLVVFTMMGLCSCKDESSSRDLDYGFSSWSDGWGDSTTYFEDIIVEDIIVEDIIVEEIWVEEIWD